MPISPVASRRTPFSFCVRTSSAPAKTACSAWARVMAGPCVISPVPLPMRRASTPGCGAKSRTPMSTGTTAHCAACAIRHTEVRPAARLRVTAAVTLLSVWVTPWATTPLSAPQHQHRTRQKRRLRVARQRRNVLQRRLQQTQAAQRLCARRPAAVRLFPRRLVRRRDVLQQFTQFHASSFFLCIPASFCFQCPGRFPKRTAPPRSRGLSKSTGPFTGRFERRRPHAQTAPPAAACPQNTGAGKLHTAPAPRTRTSSCGPSQASAR